MLIDFRVSNYRSIGEEQIISLIPAPKQREYIDNIIVNGKYKALNSISIYGANASGKTNLLLAMSLLDKLVHLSARSTSTDLLPYDPFLLREGWDKKPTKLEITFIIEGIKYRFGLEYVQDKVLTEWLYKKAQSREVALYLRQNDVIDVSSGFKGNTKIIDAAVEATRDNALFLSTCDMFNIEEAKTLFQWFKNFTMIDGLNSEKMQIATFSMWEKDDYKQRIKDYLKRLNLGFSDLKIATKDFDPSELPERLEEQERDAFAKLLTGTKGYNVMAIHQSYNAQGAPTENQIAWKFEERESAGTKKAFHLSGHVIYALIHGGVLIIDELEAKMHPIMTLDIINLFLNKETNPQKAQLIFATHDTNLLSYAPLRRDQIYFSEKNNWASTEIYALSDFVYIGQNGFSKSEKERPDTDKEKRYFEGRYGAIPILGDFKPLK